MIFGGNIHVHGVGVAVHNHGRPSLIRVTADVKHDFRYVGRD